jgi:hypothetical protein
MSAVSIMRHIHRHVASQFAEVNTDLGIFPVLGQPNLNELLMACKSTVSSDVARIRRRQCGARGKEPAQTIASGRDLTAPPQRSVMNSRHFKCLDRMCPHRFEDHIASYSKSQISVSRCRTGFFIQESMDRVEIPVYGASGSGGILLGTKPLSALNAACVHIRASSVSAFLSFAVLDWAAQRISSRANSRN